MKNTPISIAILLSGTIIATLTPTTVLAQCLVGGDIMIPLGESDGSYIGLECLNSTSFDAITSSCGPNGQMMENVEMVFSCPGDRGGGGTPYCVQCGPRGYGGALCLSTPTTDRVCPDTLPQPGEQTQTSSNSNSNSNGGNVQQDNGEEFLPPSTPSAVIIFFEGDQCDTENDIEIWTAAGGDASRPEHLTYCAREYNEDEGCLGDSDCIEECFQKTYGYTEACSACFGAFPGCSDDNGCEFICAADSFSVECKGCNAPCIDEFNECSGLPQVVVIDDTPPATTTTIIPNIIPDDNEFISSCFDGREGVDDATCTLSLREETCEDRGLNEEECTSLGCCQWSNFDGGICFAACIIPEDGEACCNNVIDDTPTTTISPNIPDNEFIPIPSCPDGRVGVDDATCTISLREETCEDRGLNEEECMSLGCCQWDNKFAGGICSAACLIPEDGEACCNINTTTEPTKVTVTTTVPPPETTTPGKTEAPLGTTAAPLEEFRDCPDDSYSYCTFTMRVETCEGKDLNEDECADLGCCQWVVANELDNPSVGTCRAACIVPEEGEACCSIEYSEDSTTPTPLGTTTSAPNKEESSGCPDGREGVDDATCTFSLREETCENRGLNEEECTSLGCCQWGNFAGGTCSAACIIPDDGDACCAILAQETTIIDTTTGTPTQKPSVGGGEPTNAPNASSNPPTSSPTAKSSPIITTNATVTVGSTTTNLTTSNSTSAPTTGNNSDLPTSLSPTLTSSPSFTPLTGVPTLRAPTTSPSANPIAATVPAPDNSRSGENAASSKAWSIAATLASMGLVAVVLV